MQILFALTLFVSATLLFAVQPMFAKMVLPKLGGTPAVWNTCMVFYQATLLAGYVYAHLTIKWLGPRRQAAVHVALFCLPWLVLPIGVAAGWTPPPASNPIPWLLMLLTISVGLPLLFVSASAPMLQAWFSATGHRSAKDPYFLYSASNLGSILALVGYPLVLEPYLTLGEQTWSWAAGYGLLMVMSLACAVVLWRSRPAEATVVVDDEAAKESEAAGPELSTARPTWTERMRWLALSAVPSSLLLGVTTYMSTDIAAAPLLWVIPLMLYLLTFVFVFARWKLLPHKLMLRVQPVLVVVVAAAFFSGGTSTSYIAVMFPLHLLAFFVTAMVCHGELAGSRPGSRWLTEFYLWMSLGGVLGGMFNALLAPVLFDDVYEYPLMIAVACLLRPAPKTEKPLAGLLDFALPTAMAAGLGFLAYWLTQSSLIDEWLERVVTWISGRGAEGLNVDGEALAGLLLLGTAGIVVLFFQRRPVRLGMGVFALLIISLIYSDVRFRPLYATRSFFGVMRVREITVYDDDGERMCDGHQLSHGSTNHGFQRIDPILRYEPCSYYAREGPVGQIIEAVEKRHPIHEIGVVGLGTGTMAAYGQRGRRITFYEIDPVVEQIARDPRLFTYLADSEGKVEVILGDARLSLATDDPRRFDVLVLDAFSSDAIPVHLLTREAMALYFQRLAEHGVLAVHVSNRHLDLEPVLANLAKDAGLVARVCDDGSDRVNGRYSSTWVAVARRMEDLGSLAGDDEWTPLHEHPHDRLWTDDYSNIIDVLEWELDLSWLIPWSTEEEDWDE